jgi:hypothetical protein
MTLKFNCAFLLLVISPLVLSEINEIINNTGDGQGNGLDFPSVIHVDAQGAVYIGGENGNDIFRSANATQCNTDNDLCQWQQIMDSSGAGITNQVHNNTHAISSDHLGNVYVVGRFSDNVWRINDPQNCSTTTTPCQIQEIIDANGDGTHELDAPWDVKVDQNGNVYVSGSGSNNVFKISASATCNTMTEPCEINEILDENGDGSNTLFQPGRIAIDNNSNVFVSSFADKVFMIQTPDDCNTDDINCMIFEIMDESIFTDLALGVGLATDSENNVYVSSLGSATGARVFKIPTPDQCITSCLIREIYNESLPQQAVGLTVDAADNVFIAGGNGDNAIKINKPVDCSINTTPCAIAEVLDTTGDGNHALEGVRQLAVFGVDLFVPGTNTNNAFRIDDVAELSDLIFEDDFELE